MKLIKVGVACVNQTPLAWDDNFAHLREAIERARAEQVTVLCLPELAITGYGCEDAFFMDGLQHTAFAQLERLAAFTAGMVVSVGLPLYHEKALYNGAALLVDGKSMGFAAKRFLAGDGIHYEPRWFKEWPAGAVDVLERITDDGHRRQFPIGDLVFEVGDVRLGFEICEDAWVANRPGNDLSSRGVDVILNPSASHFAFGKFAVRQRFVVEGSRAFGVAYLYANLVGNEAGRVIYDGGGLIASGGELIARGRRFAFVDVELATAVVDIDGNRREQARRGSHHPRHDAEGHVIEHEFVWPMRRPEAIAPLVRGWEDAGDLREEEFARAVSLGLWDYLRKSRAQGYVVSLSGGADSAACTALVAIADPTRARRARQRRAVAGAAAVLPALASRDRRRCDRAAAHRLAARVRVSADGALGDGHARGRRDARDRARREGVPRHRRHGAAQGLRRRAREDARPAADVGARRSDAAEYSGARASAFDLDARERARQPPC